MQRSSRAPVLSATFRRDSCWITDAHHPCRSCVIAAKREQRKDAGSGRSRRLRPRPRTPRCDALQRPSACEMRGWWASLSRLDDLGEPPALRRRQRARLDDAHDVADVGGVLLVVRMELDRAADDLLVPRMLLDHVHLDDDRLVHRARDDDAAALLRAAALVLRLRQPDDGLPLGSRRVHTAALLGAQGARKMLALLLRPGLSRRSLSRSLSRRFRGGAGGSLGIRTVGRGSGRLLFRRWLLVLSRRSRLRLRRHDLFLVFSLFGHAFPFADSRSLTTVRIRAISRFVSFSRALFSSAPVTDWKRRLNSSCRRSTSRCSSSSSVRSLNSLGLVKELGLPFHDLRLDGQLLARELQRVLRERLRHTGELEHDAARLDHGHPALGRALAGAHAGLGRLLRIRLVGEDVDPDLAAALDLARHGDTSRLDLAVGDPAPLGRLQAVVTELHGRLALRLAGTAAAMDLAELRLLRHQHGSTTPRS